MIFILYFHKFRHLCLKKYQKRFEYSIFKVLKFKNKDPNYFILEFKWQNFDTFLKVLKSSSNGKSLD
jgi:hypothetical protein